MRNRLLPILAGFFLAVPLFAASPYLIKDINQNTAPASSYPSLFTAHGSTALFATTDFHGYPQELWRTAGTELTTFKLANGGSQKVVWNGKVWFLSSNGAIAGQIWSTDGTQAGTSALTLPSGLTPFNLMAGPSHLYFTSGSYLWRTNGTTAGTVQVSTTAFRFPSLPLDQVAGAIVGTSLYFLADTSGAGWELWRANANGVVQVKDFGTDGFVRSLFAAGNTLYMRKSDSSNWFEQLWRSDGTAAGTRLLRSAQPITMDPSPRAMSSSGSLIYFVGDDGTGRKLWRSDGTDAGTVVLASSLPGVSATFAGSLITRLTNGTLLFAGPAVGAPLDDSYFGAWSFDGTNTTFLANVGGGNFGDRPAVTGSYAIFGSGDELWRSDGTIGGTFKLREIQGSTGYQNWPMTAVGSIVYFGASGNEYGYELWKTDGSVAGTMFVKDIVVATHPSNPGMLRPFKGGALFTAQSGQLDEHSNPTRDLWFSDGTEAGTLPLLAEIGYIADIIPCGGRAFFDHGDNGHAQGHELWVTDGTAGNTRLVKDLYPGTSLSTYPPEAPITYPNGSFPHSYACVDGVLFFVARSFASSRGELWRSDGTAAGTMQVQPLLTYPASDEMYSGLKKLGHDLFFGLRRNYHPQLWRSDGTPGGTVMVKDFPEMSFGVDYIVPSGPYVYFTASDDIGTLWRSDGTAAGTVPFATDRYVTPYADFYGRLAFAKSDEMGTPGKGLCTTDGTAAGTTCFDPVLPNSGAWTFRMQPLNGRLYYNKPDLFSTDGGTTSVAVGIHEVRTFLASAGGRLYVNGSINGFSQNVMETDGTVAGTRNLMLGLANGAVSGGGRLFIAADELYGYDLPVIPVSFAPKSIAAPGGQQITILGRGFAGSVIVRVGSAPAVVRALTPTQITFTAPTKEPGAHDVELQFSDGRRMSLDEPLMYTCAAPTAVIGASPAAACPLTPVTLRGSGGVRCFWFPPTGLDDPSSCTPTATVDTTTSYTLIVETAAGCQSTNHPAVTVAINPRPDPTITTVAVTYSVQPNTTYSASVPDAGPGAVYAWGGANVTFTSATNQRTVTYRTTCSIPRLDVVVTTRFGCAASSSATYSLPAVFLTGAEPRVANPGTTVMVKGAGLLCVNLLELRSRSGGPALPVPFTVVDSANIRFKFPPNAPQQSRIAVSVPYAAPVLTPPSYTLFRSARRDFGNDLRSDVFWRNGVTGQTMVWHMSFTAVLKEEASTNASPGWSPAAFGDFDGDGRSDIFWRNPSTHQTAIWLMLGSVVKTSVFSTSVHSDWRPLGSGDFDGNGKFDVFWSNSVTGETKVWLMNGITFTEHRSMPMLTTWQPVAFGDFNADGKGDVFWRNVALGETSVWLMNGVWPSTTVRSSPLAAAWTVSGSADFNGDRKDDLYLRHTATGGTAIWFMNGTSAANVPGPSVSPAWTAFAFGDFSADGLADVFWHNPTTGETAIWLMNGATTLSTVRSKIVSDTNWKPVP